MAAVSVTGSRARPAWLDEHHLSALSGCVSRILEEISPHLQSDTDASDDISAIVTAVRSTCAIFASAFNDRNPRAVTSRLPIELLTACLYAADIPTRIRSSHVSRSWRCLALTERGLWTDYCCTSLPWEGQGSQPSLDFLEAILQRSDPLPFRLKFPHTYSGASGLFASEAAAIVIPHLHRLQEYDGCGNIFSKLNPDELPIHALVSLNRIGDSPLRLGTITSVTGPASPHCLPNLRRLVAPVIDFQGRYYSNLQDLVCTVSSKQSENLFCYCPNLIRAEFYGWRRDLHLPCAPVPCSIQEIVLHGEWVGDRLEPDGIDFETLRLWVGEHIPQLTLLGAPALDSIVRELRLAHNEPTSLTIAAPGIEPELILASAADPSRWCWTVTTRYFWESSHCDGDLRRLFTRLQITSLSISIDMLEPLLAARLGVPRLLSLELRIAGVTSVLPTECFSIRAPGLQHLTLDFGDTIADTCPDEINCALDGLGKGFRGLIVYDAALLETITVRSSTPTAAGTDCASLARLARHYVKITHP